MINAVVQRVSRWNISYERRPPARPPEPIERLRSDDRFENAGLSGPVGRDVDAIWYGREEGPAGAPEAEIPARPIAVG